MSKGINILLALLILPTLFLALMVGFDLNALGIIEGIDTPYINEIFNGIGILAGVLLFWRAFRRWSALFIFKSKDKFVWIGSSTKTHIGRVRLYLFLEALFFGFISLFFFWISSLTIVLAVVFLATAVEAVVFIVLRCNSKYMKAGIIKNGLVIADRDLTFYYFSGLKSVSTQNESIYLEYKNDLCLSFPVHAINQEDRQEFLSHFIQAVDKKRVFVSEKLKEL
jgi:hypothetical protein